MEVLWGCVLLGVWWGVVGWGKVLRGGRAVGWCTDGCFGVGMSVVDLSVLG